MKENLFWLDFRGRTQYVILKHKASGSEVGCNFREVRKDPGGIGNKGKAAAVTKAERGRWANTMLSRALFQMQREHIVKLVKRGDLTMRKRDLIICLASSF